MPKKRKKKQESAKAETQQPAAVVQATKFESSMDAVLRRAKEKALRQLNGSMLC